MKTPWIFLLATLWFLSGSALATETVFASYFDIKTGSAMGVEVNGRLNLLRNKNAPATPVPASYSFVITSDPSNRFELSNARDSESRLFGVLRSKTSIPSTPADYALTVALRDGATTLVSTPITIRAVAAPLQEGFHNFAKTHCFSESRLYGRTTYSDAQVQACIGELETNSGRFTGYDFYTRTVASYVNTASSANNLADQWEAVSNKIGGLSYAYQKSAKYGPNGLAADHARLKNALYAALRELLAKIPVDPSEVVINGRPIGTDYCDGLFRLNEYGIVVHNDLSHHWRFTDPLTGPAVWIQSDLQADIRNQDPAAIALREKLLRFFQCASFGNDMPYRDVDGDAGRWGNLTDANHSEGAFADANLGHRMRGWVTLPAIWSDYNRPITYAPYWYDGYFSSYPGLQYRPGWSPNGVLNDLLYWTKNLFTPTHVYVQSGFQPDGTITHHSSYGGGIAMNAYGYEWLTAPIPAYRMLKNSGFDLGNNGYNHFANLHLYTYDKIAYKGDFDYTVVGRSYYSDLRSFVGRLPDEINALLGAKQATTQISQEPALINLRNAIDGGTHSVQGNFPFWVSDYMIDRKGGATANASSYFFAVKMGSNVTETADDFDSVGKSYHMGSGTLQCKVVGNEYDFDVRKRMDWHALPGLTEEWRTDAIPNYHGQQTMGSAYAGLASDGVYGFSATRYRPAAGETYAVAQADKGFFFTGGKAVALGSAVARRASGQNRTIITTIDQTRWTGAVTYSVNGANVVTIAQGTTVDQMIPLSGPTWIHQGSTGYLVFPQGAQPLYIRGGSSVLDSYSGDSSTAQVIHFALSHGTDPVAAGLTKYFYLIAPNKTAADMPALLAAQQTNVEVVGNGNNVQGIYDRGLGVAQIAFHAAATATFSTGLQIAVDRPALVQLRRNGANWEVCATEPTHNMAAGEINITLKTALVRGTYGHTLPGVVPRPGESVTVTTVAGGSKIRVPLADATNDASLDYQAALYASVPIHVSIPANVVPVAQNDSATTTRNTALSISVLSNDSDANADVLSIQSVTQGAHGTVAIAGNKVTYTPAQGWLGGDSFTYSVADGNGGTATGTVSVAVVRRFSAWIATYNVGAQSAEGDDPDRDGIVNSMEFATGRNPSTPDGSEVQMQRTGSNLVLTFSRSDSFETEGGLMTVEAGESLKSLNQVFQIGDTSAHSSAGVSISENGSGPDTITITIPVAGRASLFARLKIGLSGN